MAPLLELPDNLEMVPGPDQPARAEGPAHDPGRVLEALLVGVIVHDAQLRIVSMNPAAAWLLGVEIAEAVQRHITDPLWVVIHPDGSAVRPEDIPAAMALRTKEPVRGMIVGVQKRDQLTRWLTVDAMPLVNARGDVEHIAVTISDVTRELVARTQLEMVRDSLGRTIQERDVALTQAVQALDSSEARYRAVLRAMSEGVAVHAADGSILFANPAAEQILGLTLQQMQGQHPVDPAWRLTDASGQPLPPQQIPSEITRRTGEPQRSTALGVQRGGSHRQAWLSVSTDPIGAAAEPKNDGRYSVVATFTDVTVEREALALAQQARDHLGAIAAALPGVVIEYLLRVDGSDEFRYVSEPAREYLGLEPQAVLEDSSVVWARIHPEDRTLVQRSFQSLAKADSGLALEFRALHSDGAYHYARLRSGPPARVPEGLLLRCVIFDVTEQRRLEETVREAQRREAIGTLAAGMAHNFNNMLAVIVPSLELIAQSAPELQDDLRDARAASRAATELVRQLMQLVRKDASGVAMPVDVAVLLEEIAQMCRRTFSAGIEIRCRAAATSSIVLARRAELQQVLINLCINARDALEGCPAPRVELTVETQGDTVVVEVSDNGAGMSSETMRHLGEPFFSTKPPGRGTGLGLATAYGIVAELKGSLTCHSSQGAGTRFTLRLPRHHAVTEPEQVSAAPLGPSSVLRVLVIDDEELVRSTLRRALERQGASVLCAESGARGLDLLRTDADVSLVLLDLAMPEIGGAEVLRRLREFAPDVPVYLMTGFLPDGLEIGLATGVLLKPLDLPRVRALLSDVANRQKPRAAQVQ